MNNQPIYTQRAYEITPNSQEYKCPQCNHIFTFYKMVAITHCPNCDTILRLKGYRDNVKR